MGEIEELHKQLLDLQHRIDILCNQSTNTKIVYSHPESNTEISFPDDYKPIVDSLIKIIESLIKALKVDVDG